MKKSLVVGVVAALFSGVAMADYSYTETETVVIVESFDFAKTNACLKRPVKKYLPCASKHQKLAEPVKLKTHTEVVEHYQVLQPVTVYKPVGTEVKRYVVPAKRCDKCTM